MGSWRTSSSALTLLLLGGCATTDREYSAVLDDFRHWTVESEQPAIVSLRRGVLDIDSPAGITVWLNHEIQGPVEIEFQATAVSAGGPNDQVSDLNVFWMARNAGDPRPPFVKHRSGRFAEYDDLLTYYVGLGGNRNTTTRFRRYVGEPGNRPLLPEHDLSAPRYLLVPNKPQTIRLVTNRHSIEYWRDGEQLFHLEDPAPYTAGWFALRTTWSHLRVRNLRIRHLRAD